LHAIEDIKPSRDVFGDLVSAIVNQQLSSKAADTIYGRLKALAGKFGVTPKRIISLKPSAMRNAVYQKQK